ncbi:hypothetical protein ACFCZT_42300 [Streptomyces sp. NPDC056230]|uniref:hypothetical protein n=1 Tax=Streptomyces sp. NPDC056230 TaxID=3345754 RepID=UPI0035DA14EA
MTAAVLRHGVPGSDYEVYARSVDGALLDMAAEAQRKVLGAVDLDPKKPGARSR